MTDIKFEGWLGHGPESVNGKMEWGPFEPKKWTEDDIDIEISHCGICGSDLHVLRSGWFPTKYRRCSLCQVICPADDILTVASLLCWS